MRSDEGVLWWFDPVDCLRRVVYRMSSLRKGGLDVRQERRMVQDASD